jgi:hypothetical protein
VSSNQTVTVYRRNKRNPWRWRIQSRNRKIIAASSEGFVRLSRCLDNLYLATGLETDDIDFEVKDRIRISFTNVGARIFSLNGVRK